MYKKLLFISFIFMVAFACSASAAQIDDAVVWYKFDETSGVAVADSSGNGFDTVVSGTTEPKWDAAGAMGGCLQETGQWSKAYITVPSAVFSTVNNQATFAFWAQLTPSSMGAGGGFFTGNNVAGDQMIKTIPYAGKTDDDPPVYNGNEYAVYRAGSTATNWWWSYSSNREKEGEWHHFALVYDQAVGKGLYFDGELVHSAAIEDGDSIANIDAFKLFTRTASDTQEAWDCFKGKMDDVRIFDRSLTEEEIILLGDGYFEKAKSPSPMNASITALESAAYLDTITMEWEAGLFAASHDVYFGVDFDDVNDATIASAEFMGNQVDTTFDPALTTDGTYFWRIDEVNDIDVWKGDVWTFTITMAKIDDAIAWYKFDETSDVNVADSSGNGFDTAVSGASVPEWDTEGAVGGCLQETGQWTKMTIDVPTEVFSTISTEASFSWWVQMTPTSVGGGFFTGNNAIGDEMIKSIPYPHDDEITGELAGFYGVYRAGSTETNWWWGYGDAAPEGEWHHFTLVYDQAVGKALYFNGEVVNSADPNENDSMANIDVFKLFTRTASEAQQAWDCFKGKMDDFRIFDRALSAGDIALFIGDRFKVAATPSPVDEATDVALAGVTLSWKAGQGAVSHQVYFSDDYADVRDADVNSACYIGEQAGTTYDTGVLELMKTYYWRIDEVDGDGILWEGSVWSFSSIEYIMVEDFESYDSEGNSITAVWADMIGWGDVQISLQNDPCVSAVNAMRLRYHVPYDPYYAIANRSFSPAQDWTVNGVKMLTVHCYGDPINFGLPVFVTIGDGTTDANVVADVNTLVEGWQQINVSLTEIAAAGVDITNVTYMEIGFGDGTNVGMSSSKWDMIFVDDIALYPAKCVVSESELQADITGDCVVNYDDLAYLTNGWLSDLAEGDLNDDVVIDFADYSILASEWLVEDIWP